MSSFVSYNFSGPENIACRSSPRPEQRAILSPWPITYCGSFSNGFITQLFGFVSGFICRLNSQLPPKRWPQVSHWRCLIWTPFIWLLYCLLENCICGKEGVYWVLETLFWCASAEATIVPTQQNFRLFSNPPLCFPDSSSLSRDNIFRYKESHFFILSCTVPDCEDDVKRIWYIGCTCIDQQSVRAFLIRLVRPVVCV